MKLEKLYYIGICNDLNEEEIMSLTYSYYAKFYPEKYLYFIVALKSLYHLFAHHLDPQHRMEFELMD